MIAKKEDKRLKYRPVIDTIAIVSSVLIIVAIVLISYFSRPKNNGTYYAKIRYQNTYLWDKDDDSTKETKLIPFPKDGKKVLIYKNSDGPIFLGEGNYFNFYDSNYPDGDRTEPQIEVTLYSDCSIEITYQKSPKNVCENMGRIYYTYTPLVCLPNSFQVSIVNSSIQTDTLPDFDN